MTAFYAGPALITKLSVILREVVAFRPDAFRAQLLCSAEGITITGAAVADGMQPPFAPLAVGGVHQALFIGMSQQLDGFFFAQATSVSAI